MVSRPGKWEKIDNPTLHAGYLALTVLLLLLQPSCCAQHRYSHLEITSLSKSIPRGGKGGSDGFWSSMQKDRYRKQDTSTRENKMKMGWKSSFNRDRINKGKFCIFLQLGEFAFPFASLGCDIVRNCTYTKWEIEYGWHTKGCNGDTCQIANGQLLVEDDGGGNNNTHTLECTGNGIGERGEEIHGLAMKITNRRVFLQSKRRWSSCIEWTR